MGKVTRRVGFVATGDELVNGDILNTNTQYFAQCLLENNIVVGRHVTVSDDQGEIEQAILYLLQDHSAVITIGGLGPTSDDRTRFALADAIHQPLVFNKEVWHWIVDLLEEKGLDIPDNNRQQAMLPKNSHAIYNPNGTAAACYIEHDGHDIFMVPGPPNECQPIFQDTILPQLLKANYVTPIYRKSWLLLGVSESSIALKLEALIPNTACILGYRVHYPYLEIKLQSNNQQALEKLSQQFSQELQPKVVSESKKTASQQFFNYLATTNKDIGITDNATSGLLETTLLSPKTHPHLHFYHGHAQPQKHAINIVINGLDEYWSGNQDQHLQLPLTLTIDDGHKKRTIEKQISNRGERSLYHAVEIICWTLMQYLQ